MNLNEDKISASPAPTATVCSKCAAHFEHTIAVGTGEADILSSFEFIEEVLGDKAI